MKKILLPKYFYIFSSMIFAILLGISLVIPNNQVYMFIAMPLSFFMLSFFYSKSNKNDWNNPVYLMLIYMILGFFIAFNNMSALNIVISVAFSYLGTLLNKKETIKKTPVKGLAERYYIVRIKRIINVVVPLAYYVILELFFKLCTNSGMNISFDLISFLMSLYIIYVLYFFTLSLVKKTNTASIIVAIILLIIYITNQMRIYYTGDTFLIADILYLGTNGEIAGFMDATLLNSIIYVLFPIVIITILFIYLNKIAFIYKGEVKGKVKRVLLFATTTIQLLFLLFPEITITTPLIIALAFFLLLFIFIIYRYKKGFIYTIIKTILTITISVFTTLGVMYISGSTLTNILLKTVYDYGRAYDNSIIVSNINYYKFHGVVGGLYGKYIESNRQEPEDYNIEELKKELNKAKDNNGTWKKPNVIVVFSESFWDIDKLEGITFNKDVIENYHKLSNSGKKINMITPSYGGISSNVEFEILTGGSLNYFSKGYVPYMQLYNNKLLNNPPSIINEFNNNDYYTYILNTSSSKMFKCDNVYNYYGVKERHHLHDELKTTSYISDEQLTDYIIDYFDKKDKNQKTFFFAITMGAHMPFVESKYNNYDFEVTSTKYNDEITGTIKAYAEGIYKADKQLKRLYDYIQTLDEDTIIVFFGDHLPRLNTPSGIDAMFETNYISYDYDLESIYKLYNTEALILSNYDIDYDDTNILSPDLLLTYVMNNMDMSLSPYYKWLYSTIDSLPSSNYAVTELKDGTIKYTVELDGEEKKTYKLREKMQYMLFR